MSSFAADSIGVDASFLLSEALLLLLPQAQSEKIISAARRKDISFFILCTSVFEIFVVLCRYDVFVRNYVPPVSQILKICVDFRIFVYMVLRF